MGLILENYCDNVVYNDLEYSKNFIVVIRTSIVAFENFTMHASGKVVGLDAQYRNNRHVIYLKKFSDSDNY